MAATFNWCEDNGTATGSPAHGSVRAQNSAPPIDVSWKSIDDAKTASTGTPYSGAPVFAGQNSFSKYQYGQFSGTYNQILNGKWSAHTSPAGTLAAGLSLVGTVTSTYVTPSQAANASLTTNFTTAVAINSGNTVQFAADPSSASPAATLASGGGFTQYLVSQIQTTTTAAAGDMAAITVTLQYDEN